jgi:hypothetical protein
MKVPHGLLGNKSLSPIRLAELTEVLSESDASALEGLALLISTRLSPSDIEDY